LVSTFFDSMNGSAHEFVFSVNTFSLIYSSVVFFQTAIAYFANFAVLSSVFSLTHFFPVSVPFPFPFSLFNNHSLCLRISGLLHLVRLFFLHLFAPDSPRHDPFRSFLITLSLLSFSSWTSFRRFLLFPFPFPNFYFAKGFMSSF